MGRPKKQPEEVREIIVPEADHFDIRASKLQEEIEEKYSPEYVDMFKRLAYEISVIGLPLPEACIIVGVDYDKLVMLMNKDPIIERLIKTKDLEYKRSLLKVVGTKAKTDDKMSQWLLQTRYGNEFNPRKGSGNGDNGESDDILGMAIEFIQRGGDNSPIVNERSGKITVVKQQAVGDRDAVMKKISSILN